MKPLLTALAICAFLLPVAALATSFIWDGDSGLDGYWSTEDNWTANSGYPDDSSDTATITSTTGDWPVLDQDYTSMYSRNIDDLTMGGSADLDTSSYTLQCDVFTVNSSSTVTISNSSSGGGVTASSIVINGGSTLSVSGVTVQTN